MSAVVSSEDTRSTLDVFTHKTSETTGDTRFPTEREPRPPAGSRECGEGRVGPTLVLLDVDM